MAGREAPISEARHYVNGLSRESGGWMGWADQLSISNSRSIFQVYILNS